MGQQIETLARFVAETRYEDIPEAVRAHAKITFLDTLGVILAVAPQDVAGPSRLRLRPPPRLTRPAGSRVPLVTLTGPGAQTGAFSAFAVWQAPARWRTMTS